MKLPRGRAPNYRLKVEYKGMSQGTFIRPIRKYYLPKHLIDELPLHYDETREIMCSTPEGFMVIEWDIIEPT